MRIDVACGGTGGHTFPGLATAAELRRRGHDVSLWLAGRDVEGRSAGGWDGRVVSVPAVGFPRGLSWRLPVAAARAALAVVDCWRRMRRDRPGALLAMGSYASVGPVVAARLLRVPVVLHEANAVPGRAIALLARIASVVAISFEAAADRFAPGKAVLTGFPVRPEIGSAGERLLREGVFTVLVMGGSLGAHRVNELAVDALVRVHAAGAPIQVVHLTGRKDESWVREAYARAGVPHAVYGFLADMPAAYRTADLAISRSGAASCTELTVARVPALLVPYPFAVDDHQAANARALERRGCADVRAERELTVEWLTDYVRGRLADAAGLERMRAAMGAAAVPDATARLADLVIAHAGRAHGIS